MLVAVRNWWPAVDPDLIRPPVEKRLEAYDEMSDGLVGNEYEP